MGFNMFGRSYESVGKESADFCIKTRGKVKIKWGNKYIDLISDGKINVDAEFIHSVENEESIGSKDGIYVTGDGMVFIKYGDLTIPICGDTQGSEFVAYIVQDGKTGEQKVIAQKNIGLQFDTMDDAVKSGVASGIVYIADENAIYKVSGGVYEKLEFKLPNPFTEPIVIKVSDGSYSLLIDGYLSSSGSGIIIGSTENGLRIYAEQDAKFIDSDNKLNISVGGIPVITVESGKATFDGDVVVNKDKKVVTDTVQSIGGGKQQGFLLTMEGGESWLYLDNLVLRKPVDTSTHITHTDIIDLIENGGLEPGKTYTIDDFQNEWDMIARREEDEVTYADEEGTQIETIKFRNVFKLQVVAETKTTLSKFAKFHDRPEWTVLYDINYRDKIYTDSDEGGTFDVNAKGRIVYLMDEYGNSANYDFKHLRFLVDGKLQFTFGGEEIGTSGIMSDGSLSGEYVNNHIECDIEKLERRSVAEEDSSVSYILGEEGCIIYIAKPSSDNSIRKITGPFRSYTEIFKGNVVNVEDMKVMLIEKDMTGNTIISDIIDKKFDVKEKLVSNFIKCKTITEASFENEVSDNTIIGEEIRKLTVKQKLYRNNVRFDLIEELIVNGEFGKNTFEFETLTKMDIRKEFIGNTMLFKTATNILVTQKTESNIFECKTIDNLLVNGEMTRNRIKCDTMTKLDVRNEMTDNIIESDTMTSLLINGKTDSNIFHCDTIESISIGNEFSRNRLRCARMVYMDTNSVATDNDFRFDTMTNFLIYYSTKRNRVDCGTVSILGFNGDTQDNEITCPSVRTISTRSVFKRNVIKADSINNLVTESPMNGNEIVCDSISSMNISGSMTGNTMKGGTMSQFSLVGSMLQTTFMFDILNLSGFPGAERCTFKDNMSGCTFASRPIAATFHSQFSGVSFDSSTYPFIYNDKVVDVYINEGEIRHICMPDTVFPGMIVMYDGRKPIPTGWALCDGTNGTLNLLDKFVKFASSAGNSGGEEDGMMKMKHLPTEYIDTSVDGRHSHSYYKPSVGKSDNANDRDVMRYGNSDVTGEAGEHKHTFQLNKGTQEKFEPPFNTVIPIMYIGG